MPESRTQKIKDSRKGRAPAQSAIVRPIRHYRRRTPFNGRMNLNNTKTGCGSFPRFCEHRCADSGTLLSKYRQRAGETYRRVGVSAYRRIGVSAYRRVGVWGAETYRRVRLLADMGRGGGLPGD